MGEGEAIARIRRDFLAATAGLCLVLLLFTTWGTLAPLNVDVIPISSEMWVGVVWPGDPTDLLWFFACMAAWPIGQGAWALLVQRRRPWPMNRGEPVLRVHVALRFIPLLAAMAWVWVSMTLWGDGRYEVVPERVMVDLSGTPLQAAISATITLGGGWALVILGWPIAVAMLHQWNPGRPVAWLEPRPPDVPGAEAVPA